VRLKPETATTAVLFPSHAFGCFYHARTPDTDGRHRAAGKTVGKVCKDAAGAKELVARGVNYVSLDSDQGLLGQLEARYVKEFAGERQHSDEGNAGPRRLTTPS